MSLLSTLDYDRELSGVGYNQPTQIEQNHDKKGNIRDYATINELICLSNMENINAVFIADGMAQSERLKKLNRIAISQMKVLRRR